MGRKGTGAEEPTLAGRARDVSSDPGVEIASSLLPTAGCGLPRKSVVVVLPPLLAGLKDPENDTSG